MNNGNAYGQAGETFPRSLFGRPSRRTYRAAVAQVIRDAKSRHRLSNVALADVIGCHEDTIENAENEASDLNPVTLLNLAYAFGEDAIGPVRELYLCAPAEALTPVERIVRANREISAATEQLEGLA